MRLPIQIQGIVFRRTETGIEYLMLKRTQSRGGFWQPVTDGLEEGETIIAGLKREIFEETGIEYIEKIYENINFFQFKEFNSYKKDIDVWLTEYVFGAEIKEEIIITIDPKEYTE